MLFAAASATPTLSLNVSDLRVTNARGRVVLDAPTLSVAPGETIGIRGPSGAGKSTLLFALAGLLPEAAGKVLWGDTDLLDQSPEARAAFRAANIGLIFQDFLLFEELGAVANAGVGALFRRKSARAALTSRASEMLSRFGISDEPRNVATLSGGERQRVAVARALAHDPAILLADEPTASLDRAAADLLAKDLIALTREQAKTLIVVSHDPALLDKMDRILSVADGQLREAHNA